MVAGLLVTSPRDIAEAIWRGEAKPLHHVKVARHRKGWEGECRRPSPRPGPQGQGPPIGNPPPTCDLRHKLVGDQWGPRGGGGPRRAALPVPGVGIGWGGSPEEDPGGRNPGGWRLGLGGGNP